VALEDLFREVETIISKIQNAEISRVFRNEQEKVRQYCEMWGDDTDWKLDLRRFINAFDETGSHNAIQ
jgi:hypothetical protein